MTGPEVVFCGVAVIASVLAGLVFARTGAPPPAPASLRRVVGSIFRGPVLIAFWLVALPSILAGTLDVLVPLRMDALGASGVAVGVAFFASAGVEALISPSMGRLSDRRGRMTRSAPGWSRPRSRLCSCRCPRASCCSPSCCSGRFWR